MIPSSYGKPLSPSDASQWIKSHTPRLSTLAATALKVAALSGVVAFSLFFPTISIGLAVGAFVAHRIFIEYTQYKFDSYLNPQTAISAEDYTQENSRMLQALKVIHAIASNRHLAQIANIATLLIFWKIKAPLLILGVGIAGATLAIDYFDTRSCLKKLTRQVQRKIYNNPSYSIWEKMTILQEDSFISPEKLRQKCILERECRYLRLEYEQKTNGYTAQAYAYMLKSGLYSIQNGVEDPATLLSLGQLSVIFDLESGDDNAKFKRSPILKHHLKIMEEAKEDYMRLTKSQKNRLKQRIINPDAYQPGDPLEERVFQKVCERWRTRFSAAPLCEGAERDYLRRMRLDLYLGSYIREKINLLLHPGLPRPLF